MFRELQGIGGITITLVCVVGLEFISENFPVGISTPLEFTLMNPYRGLGTCTPEYSGIQEQLPLSSATIRLLLYNIATGKNS